MTPKISAESFSESCLKLVCKRLIKVNSIIEQFGEMTLGDYSRSLTRQHETVSYQQKDDFFQTLFRYLKPLTGSDTAQRAVKDLKLSPIVLTANHHGIEFFSQTFQARLIFALERLSHKTNFTTIPVFACGNIPLDNIAYPRGCLIYGTVSGGAAAAPLPLPLFPDSLKRCIVSAVPAFTEPMLKRALKKTAAFEKENKISKQISDFLSTYFHSCMIPEVTGLASYSEQSYVVNAKLWRQLFQTSYPVPDMIYIELEKITGALAVKDLSNRDSILSHILFDPDLRENVISNLDGISGCWHQDVIRTPRNHKAGLSKSGTLFFWGVDKKDRKLSLDIRQKPNGDPFFYGIDDSNNEWTWPFSPSAIIEGIDSGSLLPSVFTCFITLLFARGIACIGGYSQGVYLPKMKERLLTALRQTGGYEAIVRFVEKAQTDYYLDSMQPVMTIAGKGFVPAGPAEIIAGGGLTTDELERLSKLTIRQAHCCGMFETIPDALPPEKIPKN